MSKLVDAEARHRIETDFGTTFVVEAAAGTGKTTALVGRIVGLIRSGTGTLGRIVAVTFTEKAAGEMKLRLRSEIEKARVQSTQTERVRFDRALEELELAHIGTIHSFCGDLLRERPVEATIDPMFEVAAEDVSKSLADEAFDFWFQTVLGNPPEGIRRILRRRSRNESPRESLRAAFHNLREHRDFPTAWRRDAFNRSQRMDLVMSDLATVGGLRASSSKADDWLTKSLAEIEQFVTETERKEAVQGRDHDGLESELRPFARRRHWTWKGAKWTRFSALTRDVVLARRDAAKAQLDLLVAECEADLAPLIHAALQEPIGSYERLKSKSGQLDFLDLLIKTRDLVRDDATVRGELQNRFTHFFIDEFQDTDPLQAELMLLLAADDPTVSDWRVASPKPGKLFLVGDPKQSIYRFRRADIALYEDIKQRLLGLGVELLKLSTSFRSLPDIQAFINSAFAPVMPAFSDGSQAEYVPLERFRPDVTERPSIIALPVPSPYGAYGKVTNGQIDASFPEAVGAFVAWLIKESGWTVVERGQAVPVSPRHIALLSRRFRNFQTDVTRAYVRALEARQIPHVLVGGRSFHDREEIIALRNALVSIEWPDDELRVFATLRGPFFAIGDEALLAYRQQVQPDGSLKTRRLNPVRIAEPDELPAVAREVSEALALLSRLHNGRNHRPIAQTITMLLEALRAHAGSALWPNGEQALANCQRLIDMARHFEGTASSFRAFVEKLESDAESGEVNEAPIVEEGTEGVRIMTVHKAKGLEFPVVVLIDPTCPASRDKPSRHVDPAQGIWVEAVCGCSPVELLEATAEELKRDNDEAVRLAYVAATRAQDLLVLPVCGDEPIDGWLQVMEPTLYPRDSARRNSQPAFGTPAFGEDSVRDRGESGSAPVSGSVRPGLHRPQPNAPVVWWDPAILELEVDEVAPLRHQRILESDPRGSEASASELNYAAWLRSKAAVAAAAGHPSLTVKTVTAAARETGGEPRTRSEASADGEEVPAAGQPPVQIERLPRDGDRPAGRRFGTLVHAILAEIDLDAESEAIRTSAAMCGRLVGATSDEIKAAISAVSAAVRHPMLQRAAKSARAGGLRRETPISWQLADGSQLEGVVDLAFREPSGPASRWTVVDFKTDREFDTAPTQYVTQVQLYSEAVAAATGDSARGVILVV